MHTSRKITAVQNNIEKILLYLLYKTVLTNKNKT